jgi:hypothetical protein
MNTFYDPTMLPTPKRALNIINRLRDGVPPEEDVLYFTIGFDELLTYFQRVLDDIGANGQQGIKFIQADYGRGKTHFLDMLAFLALRQGFVVSIVTLSKKSAPFNQLERVVPHIMNETMTQAARRRGLDDILRRWAEKTKGQSTNDILRQIDEEEALSLLFPDFRMKLCEYSRAYNAANGPDFEACLRTQKWFMGEETKSKTFRSVPAFLSAFVQLLRYLGYSGFVVMLDEAESITTLSRISNRDEANENLRQIIDNQDLEGFYFVFASTPSFLSGTGDNGAQSYQALWRRISDPLGSSIATRSLEKTIVELPALSDEQFAALALRIKEIYRIAYPAVDCRVTDEHLKTLAQYVNARTDRRTGTLVRSTVMLLDEGRHNPDSDILSNYELVVEKVIDDEARRQAD